MLLAGDGSIGEDKIISNTANIEVIQFILDKILGLDPEDSAVISSQIKQHLDNKTIADCMQVPQEGSEMAYKIRRSVEIDGKQKWVTANNEQEYAEKLARAFGTRSAVVSGKHDFQSYALTWFDLYSKPNIERVTQTTYKRQLDRYLIPAFGAKAIEDISTDDVQALFNSMEGAKATKDKARMVLSMILDAAVEDGFISRNPVKSKKIKVTGKPSEFTKCYSVDQMRHIIRNISKVQAPLDRTFLAIQALHPMRLEEVLGLKWEDVDTANMSISICRAVTHPDRNQPEIKSPKTEASNRVIGLSSLAAKYLEPGKPTDFILGGTRPLSYTQVRRMCNRIQKDLGFDDRITPIRFRTTILTDIYANSKDVKLAQSAAGHTTAAMTLKHYIKGRENVIQAANVIDAAYS